MQGATYANIEAVKDAVRLWAISLKREFRVVKSGSKEYEVKCVNAGCPWRVHAFKGKWKSTGNVPLLQSTLVCCQKLFPRIAIYHATLLQSKCMGLLWRT